MAVTNLSGKSMPLQYMCHMNYAWVADGVFSQSIPDEAFRLRNLDSRPRASHADLAGLYASDWRRCPTQFDGLNRPEMCDPEIVFFADNLRQYGEEVSFSLTSPEGYGFSTQFDTRQFSHATRWILNNADQQVAAFVLPATCRPEGFFAAQQARALYKVWQPGKQRLFTVETGDD